MPTLEKKRLLKLADLLEEDAENHEGMKFDLDAIGRAAGPTVDWEPSLTCNTAGCAVGLACMSGAFRRAGLGYLTDWQRTCIVPSYLGRTGWGVQEEFFGITEKESNFLFQAWCYPPKLRRGARAERAVANRIRRFIADRTIAEEAKSYT